MIIQTNVDTQTNEHTHHTHTQTHTDTHMHARTHAHTHTHTHHNQTNTHRNPDTYLSETFAVPECHESLVSPIHRGRRGLGQEAITSFALLMVSANSGKYFGLM